VVLGQTAIAYFLVDTIVLRRLLGPALEEVQQEEEITFTSDDPERVYRELGPFKLNPADTTGTQSLRFLLVDIALGVSPAAAYDQLGSQKPRVRDAIIQIFSSKEVSEMDSPEDREFIKDEIRFSLNRLLVEPNVVLKVFFTEFTIQ